MKIKSIVPEVSHEDNAVEVPHIDFISSDQRWIFNDHNLLAQRLQLKYLMVRSHIRAQ